MDPYILIDITYGVDFKKIDKMAMEIGIDTCSNKRIESAIKYALNKIGFNCGIPRLPLVELSEKNKNKIDFLLNNWL